MKVTRYVVGPEQAELTILAALRAWSPDLSWRLARSLLEGRHLSVDGRLCLDESRRLRPGETVERWEGTLPPPPTADDVEFLYADDHLVVVLKPAEMVTQRRPEERRLPADRRKAEPTLDEALYERLMVTNRTPRKNHGRIVVTPVEDVVQCVHRLDRETSGLLVFSRRHEVAKLLVQKFAARTVERRYWAIVPGHPAAQTVESILGRDPETQRRQSVDDPDEGQRAVTHIRPVESLGPYSLLECRLETGRTNQIRIHLSELGHPVCGDRKYGREAADAGSFPGLALHAAVLGFEHPVTRQPMRFEAPWPRAMRQHLERLRAQRPPEGLPR